MYTSDVLRVRDEESNLRDGTFKSNVHVASLHSNLWSQLVAYCWDYITHSGCTQGWSDFPVLACSKGEVQKAMSDLNLELDYVIVLALKRKKSILESITLLIKPQAGRS